MPGKFENQLIYVTYTDQLNGSVKCLIKSKLDLTAGMYGIYKNLKIIYSIESNYIKNNLVLCNNNTTEFTIKESEFLEVLKAFKYFQEILYLNKASFEIENVKYIKHNNKPAYLQTEIKEFIENNMDLQNEIYESHIEALKLNNYLNVIFSDEDLKKMYLNKEIAFDNYLYLTYKDNTIKYSSFYDNFNESNIKKELNTIDWELKARNYINTNFERGSLDNFGSSSISSKTLFIRFYNKDHYDKAFNNAINKFDNFRIILVYCNSEQIFTNYSSEVKIQDNTSKDYKIGFSDNKEVYQDNTIVCSVPEVKTEPAHIYEIPKVNKESLKVNKAKFTRDDDDKLEFLYKAGKTINDLSEIFSRSEISIKNRLKKLCLLESEVKTINEHKEPPKVEIKTTDPKESVIEPNKEFTNNCLKELAEVLAEVDNEVKVNKAFEVSSEVISKQVKVIKNLQKITFKIESYNERYIAVTGQTYFIKDIIKRFKSKFFYNLNVNGIKQNAWILSKESEQELKELLRKEV